jgi:hypothetical protein
MAAFENWMFARIPAMTGSGWMGGAIDGPDDPDNPDNPDPDNPEVAGITAAA